MTATDLLNQPAARAIGWALVHFIWQGALIGLLTAVLLRLLRRSAADVRYVVSTIALSLMFTTAVVTGVQVWSAAVDAPRPTAGTPAPHASRAVDVEPATRAVESPARVTAGVPGGAPALRGMTVEPWLPVLVAIWLAGVLALTLRLGSGWLWVQRMKTRGRSAASPALQSAVRRIARQLHVHRTIRLFESSVVDVPTVIGWLKPVVLVPASAIAGLTPTQIEAILAHELAHVRRHDYLVNLLQTLVETLLFYHPAVWWVSRRIRTERENCCDDLAVSLCGDPYTYAKALADLEDLRGAGGELVMAASGGSLIHRVRRLLGAPTHAGAEPGWLAGSAAVIVMLGIVAGAVGTSAFEPQAPAVASGEQARPAATAAPVVAAAPRSAAEAKAAAAAGRATDDQAPALATLERAFAESRASLAATSAAVADASEALGRAADAAQSTRISTGRSSGNFTWSNNGERLEVKYDGEIEFTDDDSDVKRLSPGGTLKIRDGGWRSAHTIEFSAAPDGTISRRYWEGSTEKPFDPDGRKWLSETLPRFIRQTGIGAEARVARIYKNEGADGVLREISRIDGSYGKRIYFTELVKLPLDRTATERALVQAGKEIDSDYELASLLINAADRLLVDDGTRKAYFDAAKTIDSDYEMRRVYTAALKRGGVSNALLRDIIESSREIDSDYEEASLLVDVAALQPFDPAVDAAFFRAVGTLGSDYERGRVLKTLLARQELSNDSLLAVIQAARTMGSDYEKSEVLLATVKARSLTGAARDAYIDVASGLGDYEQGRALSALVKSERR